MTHTPSFLAFDCGATSGRAVRATFSQGSFEMKEVYRFPSGLIELQGKYYWDVVAIYEHFRKCLDQLRQEGVTIDSIGIDTWGVDFGFVAEDGSLLGNPRAYRDPYTEGIPEKVYRTIPREQLYAATGIQIMNFNSIFQLYAQTQEGFAPLYAYGPESMRVHHCLHLRNDGPEYPAVQQRTSEETGHPGRCAPSHRPAGGADRHL